MIKNQKKLIVKNLIDSFQTYKDYLIVSYQNLSTKAIDDLKKQLKKTQTKISIVKNSLLEKTLNLMGIKNKDYRTIKAKLSPLKNPTAVVFFGNKNQSLDGLKILYRFIIDQKNLQFRVGFIDNILYQPDQLTTLSTLPTKDELYAKVIGSLTGPVNRFVSQLNQPIQKLIYLLKEMSKKGGES